MVMSVTITPKTYSSVRKVIFVWVSATDGTATATTTPGFDGEIIGLTTIPAGGGSAPTDNYDVTLLDADGHDVLLGAGADRDTANTEHVTRASLAGVADSKLTLNIANAGSTKGGTVIVYIR